MRVDDAAGTIDRPPGLRLDLGGSGKGHAADRVARLLSGADSWAIDCGGDLRVGGAGAPHEVLVAHPLGPQPAARLRLSAGAVATSNVLARAWTVGDGNRAHHLLDPLTGRPVWTGILSATALGTTTVEVEALAKLALLWGAPRPPRPRRSRWLDRPCRRASRAGRSAAGHRRGPGAMTNPNPVAGVACGGRTGLVVHHRLGRCRAGDGRARLGRSSPAARPDGSPLG